MKCPAFDICQKYSNVNHQCLDTEWTSIQGNEPKELQRYWELDHKIRHIERCLHSIVLLLDQKEER